MNLGIQVVDPLRPGEASFKPALIEPGRCGSMRLAMDMRFIGRTRPKEQDRCGENLLRIASFQPENAL